MFACNVLQGYRPLNWTSALVSPSIYVGQLSGQNLAQVAGECALCAKASLVGLRCERALNIQHPTALCGCLVPESDYRV